MNGSAGPATIPREQSALQTFTRAQVRAIVAAVVLILLGVVVKRTATLQLLMAVAILGYLAICIYKMYVLFVAVRNGTPEYPPVAGDDVPIYTVLVPLYHEASVLPGLLDALGALQYPRDKLEILLLLEEDDEETLRACNALPWYARALVVPEGSPKTKPRACNEGFGAGNMASFWSSTTRKTGPIPISYARLWRRLPLPMSTRYASRRSSPTTTSDRTCSRECSR